MPSVAKSHPYNPGMPRKLSKPRPAQGARLLRLRNAAGLTQTELADAVSESQANIAFWERSAKPPRSDVLPRLAHALGVSVEVILGVQQASLPRRPKPVGEVQRAFEEVRRLPRKQQRKVIEFVFAFVNEYKRKAS